MSAIRILLLGALFSINSYGSISPNIPQAESYNISRNDIKIGKYLDEFFDKVTEKKIHSGEVYTLIKRLGQSPTFKKFQEPLRQTLLIAKAEKSEKYFKKACLNKENKENNSQISNIFYDLNKDNCLYKSLVYLNNKVSKNINLSENLIKNYFLDNIYHLLKKAPNTLFIEALKKISENDILKDETSLIINKIILEKKILPHSEILPYIAISKNLASYIQENGIRNISEEAIFKNEFQKMKKVFYQSIREKRINQAKETANQLINFFKENKKFLEKDYILDSFSSIGKNLLLVGESNLALLVFDILINEDDSHDKSFSFFHRLWPSIITGDIPETIHLIHKYKMLTYFDLFDDRLKFWISYSLRKNGEKKLSEQLFKSLVSKHPLSFYSTVAARELHSQNELLSYPISEDVKNSPHHFKKIFLENNINNMIKRILVWIHLNKNELAQVEFNDLIGNIKEYYQKNEKNPLERKKITTQFVSYVIKVLNRHDHFLDAFKYFYNSKSKDYILVNKSTIELLYPHKYLSLIKSIDRKLDPFFVLSLIRQESAFNPYARSHVGARGLMQLMPQTAKMFRKDIRAKQLATPKTNIKIGIKYLKKLLKEFNNNIIFSLAAYNAGETRVRRWRKDIFLNDDPLAIIETIPYKETRKYVQYIYRNMFFYDYIKNPQKALKVSLEGSFSL